MGISVIIPVKTPETYLHKLIREIDTELRSITHEILIQQEKGLTNAVVKGVARSRYNAIVVMDADGSHSPAYIFPMYSFLHRYDLVVGSKMIGWDETTEGRKFISKFYCWLARSLLHLPIQDPMSGFVMGKKFVFERLKPSTDWKFLLQLLASPYKLRVKEVPITFEKRKEGSSKSTLATGLKTFHSILKYWIKPNYR